MDQRIKKKKKSKMYHYNVHCFAGLTTSVDGHWGTGSGPAGKGGGAGSSRLSIQIPSEKTFS